MPSLYRFASRFVPSALVCLLCLAGAQAVVASDWTRFRGPTQTGTAAPGSTADWPADPALDVVWRVELGSGYSSLAVSGGTVYTGWAEGDSDWLGAFDAATGERKWTLRLGEKYSGHDGSHDGPIATPAVATVGDRTLVFALGAHGNLVAADADGTEVWRVDLAEMGNAPFYGYASSPLVVQKVEQKEGDDDAAVLVIEVASGEGPTVAGFDARTGSLLWQAGDDAVHYQSPVLVTLADRQQVLATGIETLYSLDPWSGEVLWSHAFGIEPRAMGPASTIPLALGDGRLLVKPDARSSTALAVRHGEDGWSVESAWTNTDLSLSYVPAVLHEGVVFGYKRGFLVAVDAASGETVWRSRPPGDGFLALADDHLVVATKKGSLHLARASADGWQELASVDVFDDPQKNNDVWSDPVVAGGDIYVRSMSELARVAVRRASEDLGTQTADAGRGDDPPAGPFADFLASLEAAENRSAAVDAFVARQAENGGFPILHDGKAIFLYRTDEGTAGIEGAMLGGRTEGEMRKVEGTDLYYFVYPVPENAWLDYRFIPGLGDPVVDPLNESRQATMMGGGGPETFSYLTTAGWRPAGYLAGEAATTGRVVHHDVPLPAPAESPETSGESGESEGAGEGEGESEPKPTSRGIDVYLPHGFEETPSEPYPVIFVAFADMIRPALELDRALDHHLGGDLPRAVVVMVGPHDPRPGHDLFAGAEAAIESFHETVVPFVVETYPVAERGPQHAYVGFGMPAGQTLAMAFDDRSRAGRVAAVQPFFLDANRATLVEAAAKRQNPPAVYLESSPMGLRAEHEGFNAEDQIRALASELEELGYQVTRGTSNVAMALPAMTTRVDEALAFALTGTPELPADE